MGKSGFFDNNKKIAIIVLGAIIVLILLFTLTPLKNIFSTSSLYKGKAGELIRQAENHYKDKDYDNALYKLDQAEINSPTAEQTDAIKNLREKILKDRDSGLSDESEIKRLIRRAKEYADNNDFETALNKLRRAREINDNSANPDSKIRDEINKLEQEFKKRQREKALTDNPEDLLRRARTSVREGDFETALKLIRRARRAFDAQKLNSPDLSRRINDSNKIYTDRMKEQARGDNPEELITQSRRAAANGDFDSAFNLLRRARRANDAKNPPSTEIDNQITRLEKEFNRRQRNQTMNSNPEELVRLAKQYAAREDYDKAIDTLRIARRANNNRTNPNIELGKEIDRLEEEYKQKMAEQARRDNPVTLISQARRAAIFSDKDRALHLLSRANRANAASRNPNARLTEEIDNLRKNYQQQQADEAVVSRPESLIREAERSADTGDFDSAIDYLERAKRANNIQERINSDIDSRINKSNENYKNKMDALSKEENPRELIDKARTSQNNKDYESALRILERARRANNARRNPDSDIDNNINELKRENENALLKQANNDRTNTLIENAKKSGKDKQYDSALRILRRARRANNSLKNPVVKTSKEIAQLSQNLRSERDGQPVTTQRTEDRTTDQTGREGGISREELNRILEEERKRMQENMSRNNQQGNDNQAQKNRINDLLNEGDRALKQKDYDRAINAYNQVIKLDENNSRANSGLAQAHLGKRNFPQALQYATRAITANPNDSNAHVVRGEVFYQNRQDDPAQAAFETAVRINPNQALAYYRLGVIYLIRNENAKAKDAFIKSSRASDFVELSVIDRSKCYYNLGKANERLRSFDEAVKAYNTSLTYDGTNYGAYISIGQVMYLQRNFNGAIANFKKSIEIKDTYHAHFWLGKSYDELKNFSEAIREYKAALELQVDNYEALFNLGRAYALSNQHDLAIAQYNRAGEKHGLNSKLLVQIGNSFIWKKDYTKAIDNYKQALAKDANDVDAYKGLGRCYEEQGDVVQAIVFLKEGANLTRDASIYAKLGELHFKLRDYEQSIESFKNALNRQPDNVGYRRLIADVYFEKKDFKNAASEYEKVISLNPREWISYHRLGDAYIELKMYEAAKTIYKRLIDRNPSYEKIEVIRSKLNQLEGGS